MAGYHQSVLVSLLCPSVVGSWSPPVLGTRGSEAVVPHGPEVVDMFYPLAADSGLPVRRGSWWA